MTNRFRTKFFPRTKLTIFWKINFQLHLVPSQLCIHRARCSANSCIFLISLLLPTSASSPHSEWRLSTELSRGREKIRWIAKTNNYAKMLESEKKTGRRIQVRWSRTRNKSGCMPDERGDNEETDTQPEKLYRNRVKRTEKSTRGREVHKRGSRHRFRVWCQIFANRIIAV